jgi:hypothetical protein
MRRESDFDILDLREEEDASGEEHLIHRIQGGIDLDTIVNDTIDDAELFPDEYDEEKKVAEVCYQYSITSFVYPEAVRAEEIEGVTEDEKREYESMMTEVERNQGQTGVGTSVRFAISAMDGMWTIDDVKELSGASRDTVETVVEQEEIRDNCELISRAKTGGMSKGIYITHK